VDDLPLLLVRFDPLGLRVCPEPGFSEGDLGGLGIPDPPRSRLLSGKVYSPALQVVCFETRVANERRLSQSLSNALVDDPSCESDPVVNAKGGYDVCSGVMTDLFRNNKKPRELCDGPGRTPTQKEELIRGPEIAVAYA